MCGICGYVGTHDPAALERMCDSMVHRGPDGEGVFTSLQSEIGLGHRRLSIIDLSPGGRQPMANENGSVRLVCNGEIYDYQDHRDRLLAKGHVFQGRSDSEVLLHLYEDLGLSFLQAINGMFALALWDDNARTLILARDHVGMKPLYYWQRGRELWFASEAKALLRVPRIPRALNRNVVGLYLRFLWVPGPETMFAGIRKLEPGHVLVWKEGRAEVQPWFRLEFVPDPSVSECEWAERVRETLLRATRRQMVSDVPLGAFLSGGLDSSSIAVAMRRSFPDRPIRCFTARWSPGASKRDGFEDDYPHAVRVARHLGIDLESIPLRASVVSLLPRLVYQMDEPDADPAIFPTYLISQHARELGITVLLSGTGGDEVFFGYRSHVAYRHFEWAQQLPRQMLSMGLGVTAWASGRLIGAGKTIPRRIRKFKAGCCETGLRRHLALVEWSSPRQRTELCGDDRGGATEPIPECMARYYEAFCGTGELNRHSYILIQTFLAAHNFLYTDKCSMAASIEVRLPLMDVELMRLCARIPEEVKLKGVRTKHVLKEAMMCDLPSTILNRKKTGFGAPLRDWIVGDLDPVIRETLRPDQVRRRGLFEPSAVERAIEQNRADRVDHAYLIFALLTLEIWQQTFLDRPAEPVIL